MEISQHIDTDGLLIDDTVIESLGADYLRTAIKKIVNCKDIEEHTLINMVYAAMNTTEPHDADNTFLRWNY